MAAEQGPDPTSSDYYAFLGVQKNASNKDIRSAYLKLAKKYHPDTGGDAALFTKLGNIYDVLKDSEKRARYDRGEDPDGDNKGRPSQGSRKADDIVYKLGVTLRELYNGKTQTIPASRKAICSKCKGSGSKIPGKESICRACNGQGARIALVQIFPGMVQRMQVECEECHGRGDLLAPKDRCVNCRGQRVHSEEIELQIEIKRGMHDGQKITLKGEGDQEPGLEPGDAVIILSQRNGDTPFIRKGDDLVIPQEITLSEALTGFKFCLTHLDGRTIVVESQPGDVVRPGEIRVVESEGFPKERNPFLKGNLYIQMKILFPSAEDLKDEATRKGLVEILPPKPAIELDETQDYEECVGKVFQEGIDSIGPPRGGQRAHQQAYMSDEEEEGGHESVGCVHQ